MVEGYSRLKTHRVLIKAYCSCCCCVLVLSHWQKYILAAATVKHDLECIVRYQQTHFNACARLYASRSRRKYKQGFLYAHVGESHRRQYLTKKEDTKMQMQTSYLIFWVFFLELINTWEVTLLVFMLPNKHSHNPSAKPSVYRGYPMSYPFSIWS